MGWYRDHVFARLMNRLCNTAETRRIRAEVCAPLSGAVLEVGFGTGLNLVHLPSTVTKLLAVDPMERGRELGADRIADSSIPVEFVGLDGESIALADDSVDDALATWTLCSIPDPVRAVRETARVLRPGGRLHFAEHGLAPDAGVEKWQHRLNPVQKRVACGCHLDRDIPSIIEHGGMTVTSLDTFYAEGHPKTFGWTFQGTAAASPDSG